MAEDLLVKTRHLVAVLLLGYVCMCLACEVGLGGLWLSSWHAFTSRLGDSTSDATAHIAWCDRLTLPASMCSVQASLPCCASNPLHRLRCLHPELPYLPAGGPGLLCCVPGGLTRQGEQLVHGLDCSVAL